MANDNEPDARIDVEVAGPEYHVENFNAEFSGGAPSAATMEVVKGDHGRQVSFTYTVNDDNGKAWVNDLQGLEGAEIMDIARFCRPADEAVMTNLENVEEVQSMVDQIYKRDPKKSDE